MKKIKGFIKNLKIRQKLMLSFTLLIIMPVTIIAIINSTVSIEIIRARTDRYSHDMILQTAKTLETRLEKIEDISFNIAFHQDVQSMLLRARYGGLSQYEESLIRNNIESILISNIIYHQEIYAIYVISISGYIYELNKTRQKYGLMEDNLEAIFFGDGSIIWFGGQSSSRVLSLARVINSTITQQPIGYLVIYVEEDFLFELIANTHSIMGGNIFIIDANKKIVSTDDKSQIGSSLTVVSDNLSNDYSFSVFNYNGEPQYVASSESMHNGWKIVSSIPVSVYNREINLLRNSTMIITLIILVIAIISAWGLSLTIARPIRSLTDIVEKYGKGDLALRSPALNGDETGELANSFNKMAENIDSLVVRVYEERLMKQDAELKSLQMQVNPHFLYNTLETINWMARIQGVEEIGVVAKSLGDLMRSTINDKDFVPLTEEISSLNNYVLIQKYRYKDRFDMDINIAAGTENLFVPKMIIQPLVENAIYHGIEPSFENGIITVAAVLSYKHLIIEVSDNGAGMQSETIDKIIISVNTENYLSDSIGLRNVIKRINTLFGNNEYGVDIQSEVGKGTGIKIKMPAIIYLPWKATGGK